MDAGMCWCCTTGGGFTQWTCAAIVSSTFVHGCLCWHDWQNCCCKVFVPQNKTFVKISACFYHSHHFLNMRFLWVLSHETVIRTWLLFPTDSGGPLQGGEIEVSFKSFSIIVIIMVKLWCITAISAATILLIALMFSRLRSLMESNALCVRGTSTRLHWQKAKDCTKL